MKKKLFLMGMLGIVLTFGLALVGCDKDDDGGGGGGSSSQLQGTWYYRSDGQIYDSFTFSGSNYTYRYNTSSGLVIGDQGTYSVSNGVIVFRYTKIRDGGVLVDADDYYTYSYSFEGSSLVLDGDTYNK
jgi:hypothetical protein